MDAAALEKKRKEKAVNINGLKMLGVNIYGDEFVDLDSRSIVKLKSSNYPIQGILVGRKPFPIPKIGSMKQTSDVHAFFEGRMKDIETPEGRREMYLNTVSVISVLATDNGSQDTYLHAVIFTDEVGDGTSVVVARVPTKTYEMYNKLTDDFSGKEELVRALTGKRVLSYSRVADIADLMYGPIPRYDMRQLRRLAQNRVIMDRSNPTHAIASKPIITVLEEDTRVDVCNIAKEKLLAGKILTLAGIELNPAERSVAMKMLVPGDHHQLLRLSSTHVCDHMCVFPSLEDIAKLAGTKFEDIAVLRKKKEEPKKPSLDDLSKKCAAKANGAKRKNTAPPKSAKKQKVTPEPKVPTPVPEPEEEPTIFPLSDDKMSAPYLNRTDVDSIVLGTPPFENGPSCDAMTIVSRIQSCMGRIVLEGVSSSQESREIFQTAQKELQMKFGKKSALFILSSLIGLLIKDYGKGVDGCNVSMQYLAMCGAWGERAENTCLQMESMLAKCVEQMDKFIGVEDTTQIIGAIASMVLIDDEEKAEEESSVNEDLSGSSNLFDDEEEDEEEDEEDNDE